MPLRDKPITLAGLARQLVLHPSSVSRALDPTRRHLISPEVVARVQQAAERQGYLPNRAAAALRTGKSQCVGILLPDITNPVFPPILRGIEDGLREGGLFSLVANAAGSVRATQDLMNRMLAQGVDGVILATASRKDSLLPLLRKASVPVVLVNRVDDLGSCPSVVSDDRSGMAQLMNHLTALGHAHIAYLAGPKHLSTGERRLQAFCRAMDDAGLDSRWVEACDAYSIEAGYMACKRLLTRMCSTTRAPGLTALVACNDLVALGAIDALRESGLRVPRDVSVTGHNDMPLMDRIEPALTTIRIQHHEMGRAAAQLLLQAMANPSRADTTIVLRPELVVRGSTAQASTIPFPSHIP
ncbi:MAG: LacI family DNA-binding transcriptional regulator [Polaromonas sp.]|nr:LacI family DNA-binding transcriptional regulator [Polaromonas sp.]